MVTIIIKKRHLYYFSIVIGIVVGILAVNAYNSGGVGGNPSVFGHSVDEMDWSKQIRSNVSIGGSVGIGVSNPKAKLHVNGEIIFGPQNNISLTIIEGDNPNCPAGKAIIAKRMKEKTCVGSCNNCQGCTSCTNAIMWFNNPHDGFNGCSYHWCSDNYPGGSSAGTSTCITSYDDAWSHVLCG